jgi:hypothetical protein
VAADRDLLFGVLALQIGLIEQGQLVAAFQAWTRDRSRALAEHLVARGDIDGQQQKALAAMAVLHVKKHGGDEEKSLASIPAGPSTREKLAAVGDAELNGSIAGLGIGGTERAFDAECTSAAEADRAKDVLRRAVPAGFRKLAVIRTNPDLAPLRARADFQLLLMDLAMPSEPFALPRS